MSKPSLLKPLPTPDPTPDPVTATPFIDDYLAALLAQASHLISHEFHLIVRAQGLTVHQWRVLATLADGQTASVGDVSRRTVTPQPTVSRIVDGMESLHLVTRRPDPLDRRISLLKLTPGGRRLASRLVRLARAHEDAVLAPVGEPGAATLKRALRQLIAIRNADGDPTD